MRTLFLIMAAITALAGLLNPWHLIFSGMFLIGFLLVSVASEKENEKAHYRRAYWRRYQYQKNDEEI